MDPDNDGNFKRIDIVAPSRRYMFLAESAAASKEWYDAVRRVIAGEPPAPKSTPNTTTASTSASASASTSKLSMRVPLPTSSHTESPVAAYSTAATDRWSATNHNEGETSSTASHATNRHQRSSDHQRHRNGTNNATRSNSAARSAAAAAATRRASVEGEAPRHKARPIRVRLVHKKAANSARKDKDEDDEDEDEDDKDDRYGDYAKSSARQPRQHSSSIGQYGSRPSDRQPPTLPSSSSSSSSSSSPSQRQSNASSYHSRDTSSSSSSFVPLRASQPQPADGLPPPPPGIRSATQLMGARDPREYGGSVQHAPAPGGVYPSQLAGRTGRLPVRTASVIVRELDGGTF